MLEEERQGAGNQGGAEQAAAITASSEIAIVALAQEELRLLTVSAQPLTVVAAQRELLGLVEHLGRRTERGTRASVLLTRAGQAMARAAQALEYDLTYTAAQAEQQLAWASLHRLLREYQPNPPPQGGGQQQPREQDPPPQGGGQQSPPQAGDGGTQGSDGNPSSADQQAGDKTVLPANQREDTWLHLPERLRQRLQEAENLDLPPGAMDRYRRYLEILEDEQP